MKRLYAGAAALLFLLAGFSLNAQVTLSHQHVPQPGDIFVNTLSSPDGVLPGPSGPNLFWDFSGLDSVEADTMFYIEPEEAAYSEVFPGATIAFQEEEGTFFLQATETEYLTLGGVGDLFGTGNPIPLHYEPPLKQMVFPATYGTTFSAASFIELSFGAGADSSRLKIVTESSNEIDSYGTVSTPAGSYEALRRHSIITGRDSFWIKAGGNWMLVNAGEETEHSYQWLSPEGKGPVVTIDTDDSGNLISVGYLYALHSAESAPVAGFSFTDLGDGQIQFSDNSQNEPVFWFWDFGDGATGTEQNPMHTYTASRAYSVCLTAGNDAGTDTDCQMVDVVLSSAYSLRSGDDLLVFPNPAGNQVRFRLRNGGGERFILVISNESGQVLYRQNFIGDTLINTGQWPEGAYLYQLHAPGGEVVAGGKLLLAR